MLERIQQSVREFLPQTPDPIVVITGDQYLIEQARDQFYDKIMDYLGLTQPARRMFAERGTFALSSANYEETTIIFNSGIERVGDNFACFLTVGDLPVAGALIRRDSFNYVQGVFYHNLTVDYERKVRERVHSHSNNSIIYLEDPFSRFL